MLHAGLCIFSKSDQTREKKPPKESLILIFFSPKKTNIYPTQSPPMFRNSCWTNYSSYLLP